MMREEEFAILEELRSIVCDMGDYMNFDDEQLSRLRELRAKMRTQYQERWGEVAP
jgi:hypothetical protein